MNATLGKWTLDSIYQCDALVLLAGLPSRSVDLVLTDIPYGEVHQSSYGLRNLDKHFADAITFDLAVFVSECMRVCKGSLYIFCGIQQAGLIYDQLRAQMSSRHCVWEKTNPSPMNGQYMWLSSFENCVYGKQPSATFNAFCQSAVWRFPSGTSNNHPTEKPKQLFEYLISTSTNEGDLVVDPCVGSGTTAHAARNLKRRYICGDVSSECVAMAKDRLRLPFERKQQIKDEPLEDLPLFRQTDAD